jgi:hypothetical protein
MQQIKTKKRLSKSHGATIKDQRKPMILIPLTWASPATPIPPSTPTPTLAPLLACNEPISDVEIEIVGSMTIPAEPQMVSACKSDNSIMRESQGILKAHEAIITGVSARTVF